MSRIRATVRAGRDAMRETLLVLAARGSRGARVLDAGCGTGALSVAVARRGADVLGVDVSPTLVGLARERAPQDLAPGGSTFAVGDMLDPALGRFDYVVAMDSLIHYEGAGHRRARWRRSRRAPSGVVLFTIAPRTVLLTLMHAVGRFFPRGDRAPAIAPIRGARSSARLRRRAGWRALAHRAHAARIVSGFYISRRWRSRRS